MSRRVVLYYPERGNPDLGQPYSADLLPLEFLHIAATAQQEGFEIDIVDSMIEEKPLDTLFKKLEGAFAFGSTCIVGYQVADGAEVAQKVREKYPKLPMIWGGWFPSVAPELYLSQNLADAVCIGQGEVTFKEWLVAVRDGTPVEDVAGLALWRDGKPYHTPKRAVVQMKDLPEPDFDLIPVTKYLDIQERQASTAKVRYRFPNPPGYSMEKPYRAISFFSSFGCPEPCSFCCSPLVTNRRWVALPAKMVVDRLERMKAKYGFNVVRFQDANFGVNPRRINEFCRELIDRKMNIHWNATIEVETILKCDDETLDLMRDSGCHMRGRMIEYKFENTTFDLLPARIKRDYHRYTYLVPWFDGLVRGDSAYHRFLRKMAGYRLSKQWYGFPIEFKLYDWNRSLLRLLGLDHKAKLAKRASGVSVEGTLHNVREAEALTR